MKDLALKCFSFGFAGFIGIGLLMVLYENLNAIVGIGVALLVAWIVLGFIGAGLGIRQD